MWLLGSGWSAALGRCMLAGWWLNGRGRMLVLGLGGDFFMGAFFFPLGGVGDNLRFFWRFFLFFYVEMSIAFAKLSALFPFLNILSGILMHITRYHCIHVSVWGGNENPCGAKRGVFLMKNKIAARKQAEIALILISLFSIPLISPNIADASRVMSLFSQILPYCIISKNRGSWCLAPSRAPTS